jgi:hypothetical protein
MNQMFSIGFPEIVLFIVVVIVVSVHLRLPLLSSFKRLYYEIINLSDSTLADRQFALIEGHLLCN